MKCGPDMMDLLEQVQYKRRRQQDLQIALANELCEDCQEARDQTGQAHWPDWQQAPATMTLHGCTYIRADLTGAGLDTLEL